MLPIMGELRPRFAAQGHVDDQIRDLFQEVKIKLPSSCQILIEEVQDKFETFAAEFEAMIFG